MSIELFGPVSVVIPVPVHAAVLACKERGCWPWRCCTTNSTSTKYRVRTRELTCRKCGTESNMKWKFYLCKHTSENVIVGILWIAAQNDIHRVVKITIPVNIRSGCNTKST